MIENNSVNLIREFISSGKQMLELRNKVKQGELNPYAAALKLNKLIDFNNENDLLSK